MALKASFLNLTYLKQLQISLAGRYAHALFDIAKERNETHDIHSIFCEFNDALKLNPSLLKALPLLKSKNFSELMAIIQKKFSWPDIFISFLSVLYNEHRLSLFPKITMIYHLFCQFEMNCFDATVATPNSLSDLEKKSIQTQTETLFKTSFDITYDIDKTLLGGLHFQVQNTCIDASLKNQLILLENTLKGAA